MLTCFVIQPFDGGKFDKRYKDVFKPAIEAANLLPYRVNEDSNADVLVEAIENGIRSSAACLADITTDNPNVWYELGFAFASGRPVVMVCGEERSGKKYPFDIQHRAIIPYQADSLSDFEILKDKISKRLEILMKRTDALQNVLNSEQIAPLQGLSQPELAVLATIAGSVVSPNEGVSAFAAKNDTERAGFTSIGFTIGLTRLINKQFVNLKEEVDFNNNSFSAIYLTAIGWNWIEQNSGNFILQKPKETNLEDINF